MVVALLAAAGISSEGLSTRALLCVHAEIKYDGYIQKEEKEVTKMQRYQQLVIPDDIDYQNIPGLTKELQEKLMRYKPKNIAQVQLIPGITPAAISLLIFYITDQKKKHRGRK